MIMTFDCACKEYIKINNKTIENKKKGRSYDTNLITPLHTYNENTLKTCTQSYLHNFYKEN